MSFDRFPPIPPRRTDVNLDHVRVRPDGSLYVVVKELMAMENVKDQLAAIKAAKERQHSNQNKG